MGAGSKLRRQPDPVMVCPVSCCRAMRFVNTSGPTAVADFGLAKHLAGRGGPARALLDSLSGPFPIRGGLLVRIGRANETGRRTRRTGWGSSGHFPWSRWRRRGFEPLRGPALVNGVVVSVHPDQPHQTATTARLWLLHVSAVFHESHGECK